MTEQETREMLAEAILRGEAVCYGFRIEQTDAGLFIDALDGGKAYFNGNALYGLKGPIYVCTRGDHSDGSPDA